MFWAIGPAHFLSFDMTHPIPARLVIATRESRLALWQAEHIRDRLRELYPQMDISLLGMTTQGDRILDRPLAKIGGKGLFVKELESALESGAADLAVHSMKDVPMVLPEGFVLTVVGQREDPRDAFLSNRYTSLAELPEGAIVGTSSLRRESQLRARHPRLRVEALRGNVETRLRKLDEGRYGAIILAAAGLKRLGLAQRITALLSPEESLPAVGQGALGIEFRTCRSDVAALLQPLSEPGTSACVLAERALSRRLTGSCEVPLGGHATLVNGALHLTGFVATPDGMRMVVAQSSGAMEHAEALGTALAETLLARGADQILAALQADAT
jgi:hydroxymethylbilane synthase